MGTVVEKLSNCYVNLLTPPRFPDLCGKVFLTHLNSPNLLLNNVLQEQCKQENAMHCNNRDDLRAPP